MRKRHAAEMRFHGECAEDPFKPPRGADDEKRVLERARNNQRRHGPPHQRRSEDDGRRGAPAEALPHVEQGGIEGIELFFERERPERPIAKIDGSRR